MADCLCSAVKMGATEAFERRRFGRTEDDEAGVEEDGDGTGRILSHRADALTSTDSSSDGMMRTGGGSSEW
jgi:hypothetical protein